MCNYTKETYEAQKEVLSAILEEAIFLPDGWNIAKTELDIVKALETLKPTDIHLKNLILYDMPGQEFYIKKHHYIVMGKVGIYDLDLKRWTITIDANIKNLYYGPGCIIVKKIDSEHYIEAEKEYSRVKKRLK